MKLSVALLSFALASACGRTERDAGEAGGAAGTNDAAAGSGGTGGSAGTSSSGGTAPVCPSGLPGPTLVAIETSQGWFCIDGTEVKNVHYAEFVSTKPPVAGQPTYCSFNQSYTGFGTATSDVPTDTYPYGKADWCDARAYCQWAGKRLCGRISGGSVDYTDYDNAGESEWYFVCSAGGTKVYPYGNTYNENACGTDFAKYHKSGAIWTCVGGFAGVYDMSGNASEWEDSCDAWTGVDDRCRTRGGGPTTNMEQLRCQSVPIQIDRGAMSSGIRCCADAVGAPR